MNRRNAITLVVGLLFVLCLAVQTASAFDVITASVSIQANQHGTVHSTEKHLAGQPLEGRVESYDTSTSNDSMSGYLDTHGSVFTVNRDSASVQSGGSRELRWSNSGSEYGGFSVSIISPGSHDGICTASTLSE